MSTILLSLAIMRDALVTGCGRICIHRKKVHLSGVLAGQRVGIKEVSDRIWLVTFMHCDPGVLRS